MCSKDLTSLKKELIWLKEPDKYALQNCLKNLDAAYKKFFTEHTGYPKFKTKKIDINLIEQIIVIIIFVLLITKLNYLNWGILKQETSKFHKVEF